MAEISTRSLARNSFFAGVAYFWRLISRFILTPIVIARLGLEGYGTWSLLFGVFAWTTAFNTSIGLVFAKYTAEFESKGEFRRLSEIINSGIVVVGVAMALAVTGISALRFPLLRLLQVPDSLLEDAGLALVLVGLSLAIRLSLGCVHQVLAGLQRIDLQFKLAILASAIEFVLALLLIRDYGLLSLAIGNLVGETTSIAIGWVLCRRLCPQIRLHPRFITRRGLRETLGLAARFQLLSFLQLGNRQGVKLVVSALCGVVMLAQFEIAYKLLQIAWLVSGIPVAPLMPAFASLHSTNETGRLRSLFLRSSKVVAVVTTISLGFLWVFAEQLVFAWTAQPGMEVATWTIRVMAIGHFFRLLTGAGSASLRGKGTVRLELGSAVLEASCNLVLVVPVFLIAGYHGLIVLLSTSMTAAFLWFLGRHLKEEGVVVLRFLWSTAFKSLLVGAGCIAVTVLLRDPTLAWLPDWPPRYVAAAGVLIWAVVFSVVVGSLLSWAVFTPEDRAVVWDQIRHRRGSKGVILPPEFEDPESN